MTGKIKKIFALLLSILCLLTLFSSCSSADKNSNGEYAVAKNQSYFHSDGDRLCFVKSNYRWGKKGRIKEQDNLLIVYKSGKTVDLTEQVVKLHDNKLVEILCPQIVGDNVYYVASVANGGQTVEMINVKNKKAEKIFSAQGINAFAVYKDHLYCSADHSLFSKNLKNGEEKNLTETVADQFPVNEFSIYNDTLFMSGNMFSFKDESWKPMESTKEFKNGYGPLGFYNDKYYVYYYNHKEEYTDYISSIDLVSSKVENVSKKVDVGFSIYNLCGDRVVGFAVNDGDTSLKPEYVDLKTNKDVQLDVKSSKRFRSPMSLESDCLNEQDICYFNGDFYIYYPETTVKINEKTGEELILYKEKNSDKYKWLNYDAFSEIIKESGEYFDV